MTEASGYFTSEEGHRIQLSPDVLRTISRPERAAYALGLGIAGFIVLILLSVQLVTRESDGDTAGAWWALLISAPVILGLLWLIHNSVIRLSASLGGGIAVTSMHRWRVQIPWHAVDSIRPGPRGGTMEIGYKRWGGGRVGYLAGAECIIIAITPGHPNLAREYFVSVPEPEAVTAKLRQLRSGAGHQQGAQE